MSEETAPVAETKRKRGKRQSLPVATNLTTVSAQLPDKVHIILESGAPYFALDKAGMVRLAVRMFILSFYRGNGDWEIPSDVENEIVYASGGAHVGRGLPE